MADFKLTDRNYYGPKANQIYISVSQVKDFMKCPACALAKVKGDWTPDDDSRALLVSSYMDTLWDGKNAVDKMTLEHRPQLYTRTGEKRADIKQADIAYMRAQRSKLFCQMMAGEHQGIYTGEIEGVPFKIKMDSYFPPTINEYGEIVESGMIVDEKYMKDFSPGWVDGQLVPWVDKYDYPLQLAAYREIMRQNTGVEAPCYIAAISKEKEPDLQIIEIPDWKMNERLSVLKYMVPLVQKYKTGELEAPRCEHCDYCKATKVIEKPITYDELLKNL